MAAGSTPDSSITKHGSPQAAQAPQLSEVGKAVGQEPTNDPLSRFYAANAKFTDLYPGYDKLALGRGVEAHQVSSIKDPVFMGIIDRLVGDPNKYAHFGEISDARRAAAERYVAVNITKTAENVQAWERDTSSFSYKTIKMVCDAFPKELDGAIGWAAGFYDSMRGDHTAANFDEKGQATSIWEELGGFVYTLKGEPVAVGGIYADNVPGVGCCVWGLRLAIREDLRGGPLFGQMLGHIADEAYRCIQTSIAGPQDGRDTLRPMAFAFTEDADWNARVIDLYKNIGFVDTGQRMNFGEQANVVLCADMLDPKLKRRIDRIAAHFKQKGE